MANERVAAARRLFAGGLSVALGVAILKTLVLSRYRVDWRDATLAALTAGPLAVAALLVWSRRTGPQLLARACWWGFLIVGVMAAAVEGGRHGAWQPVFGVMCAGLALLAIGRVGLDESGRFRPVAFRGTIQLSLTLAMADTASLAMWGLALAMAGSYPQKAAAMLALAAATGLGVAGLLRLRTWGLLVAFFSNLLVGTLAVAEVLPVPRPLRFLLGATASLQLVVPLPMLVTLLRRRAPSPDRWNRLRSVGATAAIVGLMALGVYAGVVRDAPLFLFRPLAD